MLGEYLRERAETSPDAPAILARRRAVLSYAGLLDQVAQTVDTLNRAGYGRGDRIALVLPPGPETTVALLAVLTGCVCVPLNPGTSASELTALLSRCGLDALITLTDFFGHLVQRAAERGIPVIDLAPLTDEAAGRFHLSAETRGPRAQAGFSNEHELSALFVTSGTTSLPKLIPLTQADLCYHGQRAMRFLGLTSSDRCLDLLPPFHHDAMACSILSTVFAGASSVYPLMPSARHFLRWAREFRPTWCGAPPPFFHSLLSEVHRNGYEATELGLRRLFTCGAPLDEDVAAALEQTLQTPLLNCYGATECGNISVTPASLAARKRGSAGISVGLEIRIVGASGDSLPEGQQGEIVVRGPGVFRGYEADPDDNANTFFGEWYRTGDLGYLDGDGYLFLVGRIQELINRGGEKIAPMEIDEVLRSHPDVEEAAAFAVPHALLGEDVAAVVVLKRPGVSADDIRRFASERLTGFKVPRRLLIVPEIPKGPTGKVQRRQLATLFADELARAEQSEKPKASVAAHPENGGIGRNRND